MLARLMRDVRCACLWILEGWFGCLSMYNGSSLGFLYGLYFPLLRSKVTSKKFTTRKFASAVIFELNLLECFGELFSRFICRTC
jgi:hypothetical protein